VEVGVLLLAVDPPVPLAELESVGLPASVLDVVPDEELDVVLELMAFFWN